MPLGTTEFAHTPAGTALAFQRSAGKGPTIVWLSGYRSDMMGIKAVHLHAFAEREGRAFLRFDYTGCGESAGDLDAATLSDWIADTLLMLDEIAPGPVVLVGSSMGGWLALLAARARPERVKALLLIAPAPDFTERLIMADPEIAQAILRDGRWVRPSPYGGLPYAITRALVEDGRRHLLLHAPIPFDGPVRMLHGQADADVPHAFSLETGERLTGADVEITLVKGGDHRLSTPADLDRLERTLAALLKDLGHA